MAKHTRKSARPKNQPEVKFGPYAGGVGIAIWKNRVETDEGVREYRSITVNTRRYLDKKTDEWRDSGAFRPEDLPAVMHGLSRALDFIYSHPLSQEPEDNGEPVDGDGEIPF